MHQKFFNTIGKHLQSGLVTVLVGMVLMAGSGLTYAQTPEKIAVKPVEPFYKEVDSSGPKVYEPKVTYLSPLKDAPIRFSSLGATWDQMVPAGTNIVLEVRFKNTKGFSEWYVLEPEIDFKENEKVSGQANAFLTSNQSKQFQYRITLNTVDSAKTPIIENLKFTFISGGSSQEKATLAEDIKVRNRNNQTVIETDEFLPENFDSEALLGANVERSVSQSGVVKSTSLTAEAEKPTYTKNVRVKKVTKPSTPVVSDHKSNLNIISRSAWGADENLRLATAQADGVEAELIKFEDDYYEKFANELKVVKTVSTDANGSELTWPQTYPEKISKIIVHHTATANNLDDPKRAIRDIYYWHTISKGWGDIGYNYIIDQQGNIYEGRAGGDSVVGAHAGRGNHGSIGIAVLGNYQDGEPPEAVVKSLTALIKEKATLHNIDTEGSSVFRGENYPNVMGHRDVMTTACPGEKLYAMLPLIKKMAKVDFSKSSGTAKANADYDLAYNESPSLVKYDPKGRKEITLNIKNTGKKAWPASTYFQINNNASSKMFLRNSQEILSSAVGKEIKPGESVKVKILTFANSTSGSAVLEVYPVVNGKKIERYLPLAIQVAAPAPKLKYDYELVSIVYDKENFKKGDIVNARISIRNKGTATWVNTGANRVTLGADKPRDHFNSLMSKPSQRLGEMQESMVKSGNLATFTVKLKVPIKDGIYREYFAPVVEGVQWMENKNSFIEIKIGNVKENASPEPADDFENSGVAERPVNSTSNTASADTRPSGGSNVNIASANLDVNKAAGNIRIDLGYRGNPAYISANGQFSLYDGARQIKAFQADQKVKVELLNGSFTASYGTESWKISRPLFKPASGVIMRIDNWERRNTWGDKANNNEFRGNLEVLLYDNELHVINELPLEDYLKGIAEESGTAPQDKIKTIMVLARTYARFYMEVAEKFPGAPFHLNDDPNTSQKYMGYAFEKRSAGTVAMVEATKGKVVTYGGKLIKTPYFSKSNGKATISAKDKWGWTDTPFLQSVDDSHCASTAFSGHGVGLSGCGATELAKRGKSFEEIIKYYYKGVEVTQTK
jgi:hypothetical protein